jgi:hypothetical protein
MEIKLTTEQIVRETKTIDIELPFFYHWRSVYSTDSDSLYDMQDNVWGIIYLAKDDCNEDVIRTTRFRETIREYYDHDKSKANYDIESDVFYDYSQRKSLEDWLKHKCTEDEFNRESTRIFKSITNQ